jgi:hypothetical protein
VSGFEHLVLDLDEDKGDLDALLNQANLDGLKQVSNSTAQVYLNLANAAPAELAEKGLMATETQPVVVNDVTYQEYTCTVNHQEYALYISGVV